MTDQTSKAHGVEHGSSTPTNDNLISNVPPEMHVVVVWSVQKRAFYTEDTKNPTQASLMTQKFRENEALELCVEEFGEKRLSHAIPSF